MESIQGRNIHRRNKIAGRLWYIVNEKKKEARLLFSKTATNKMIGDIIKILSC